MKVIYHDLQGPKDVTNGPVLSTPADMTELFGALRHRKPFLFDLLGENGHRLTIGYSEIVGAVQHASSDGRPPYYMAVNEEARDDDAAVEFLAGGTPTPILGRFCLPIQRILAVATEFVVSGERSPTVNGRRYSSGLRSAARRRGKGRKGRVGRHCLGVMR
jgi:hypothetical protein